MSENSNVKSANGLEHQVTQLDEKKKMASIALKHVDQLIKTKEYQKALLETAHAKEIDPQNVYAIALEERIGALQAEDSKALQQEAQRKVIAQQNVICKNKLDIATVVQGQTDIKHAASQTMPSTNIQSSQRSLKNDINLAQKSVDTQQKPAGLVLQEILDINCNSQRKRMPKVVLIDDDVNLLAVLKMTIESGGFEVIPLSTSDEAYMLLKKMIPDVILCDINLETSTMGGFSFFEKVHQIESIKHVPFIFLSGLSDDVLIRTGKEMGVDDYLTKPIKEQNLLAAIRGRIKRFEELGIRSSTKIQGSTASLAYGGIPS
jgi:CheY-like chemotaxis protein